MTPVAYKRLSGRRRTLAEVTSLYLGQDHILQVRSSRISEDYRRFYFQDVQSLTIRKTAALHFVWAGFIVLVALLVGWATGDVRWPLGLLAAGALFLWLRGPSCDVRLQTGVSSERLRSLHRLKTAQRVVPLLRERIEAVQGRVVSVPDDYAASSVGAPPPPPLPSPDQMTHGLAPRRNDHAWFFGFLAIEAAVVVAWLFTGVRGLEQAAGAAAVVEFLAVVMVMVRQSQQRVPRMLRNMIFVAAGRWFLAQSTGMVLAYKAVLFDGVKGTLDPMTIVRGTFSYISVASLAATAAVGMWLSLRTYPDE